MFKFMIFKSNDFVKEPWFEMEFMNPFIDKVFNHKSINPKRLFSIPNVPGNKLYLRSFLENNNIRFPSDVFRQEDNQFLFNVITHAERVSLIDEHFYNYRINPNSIMRKHDKSLLDNIKVAEYNLSVFLDDDELYERYKVGLWQYVFAVTLKSRYDIIDDEYKEEFYTGSKLLFDKYYNDERYHDDILNYVNESILEFYGIN